MTPQQAKACVRAYQSEGSFAKAAAKVGFSACTVRAVVLKAGITPNPVGQPKGTGDSTAWRHEPRRPK